MSSVMPSSLECSVLVLNKLYMAIRVIPARRAFVLLAKDNAEVVAFSGGSYETYPFSSWLELSGGDCQGVDPEDDFVRAARRRIRVPRIIRLLGYDRLPRQRVRFNRRNLYARDEHRCQYCGTKPPSTKLNLDHVTPRSRGGQDNWDNVVCSCVRCNTRKGGRTPLEAGMPLMKEPSRPMTSPLVMLRLSHRKYMSWSAFLEQASWAVEFL